MKTFRHFHWALAGLLLFGLMQDPLQAQGPIRIRIGSVAPKDSLWHDVLKYLKQDWETISGGQVNVRIYEGGKLGDEAEMVKMVQARRIEAVGLSSVGLSRVDPSVACLQVPMMLRSYQEYDYVLERIGPRLEQALEAKGFKLLHWADAGWVRTFAKGPVRVPDDLRKAKLFTSAGDPESERLYKEFGFQVYSLSMADMIPSLQTGMINAINIPPLYALMNEAYRLVPNMTDVKWTPLAAGTVIDLRVWNSLPESFRAPMLEAARRAGDRFRDAIRKMGEDSILEMEKRGLKVLKPNDAEMDAWQREAEKTYPQLRGRYTPADLFDEVLRLRDAFRESAAENTIGRPAAK